MRPALAVRLAICFTQAACCLTPAVAGETDPPVDVRTEVRRPVGPDDLPQSLPGRWEISLCVADDNGHAWIRFENLDTGEVRSISRFHVLVGGWFDRKEFRWNYAPTFRTGLHMDREQRREPDVADGSEILRTTVVEDPQVFVGKRARGHALVRNNCATYARDAWYFYTGEYWELPEIHSPKHLRESIGREHPAALTAGQRAVSEKNRTRQAGRRRNLR